MFDYPWGDFALNLLVTAGAVVVFFAIVMAIAHVVNDHSIIDITWGPAFVVIAVVSWLVSAGSDGDDGRRLVVLLLTAIWGLRLGLYIGKRNIGKGEDPRYTALLRSRKGRPLIPFLIKKIYGMQAVLAWIVSIPVQFAVYVSRGIDALVVLAIVIWTIGFLFESVGDWQLARFKADPANAGKTMDRGLWSWTRHPNYFGDACVWVGLFLLALGSPWGVLTVFSPILMTWLLTTFSGAKLTEKGMRRKRGPEYDAYLARTSFFFPRPPRKVPAEPTA